MTISQEERDGAVVVYPAGYSEFGEEIDPKMQEEDKDFDAFKQEMHESNDEAKITVSKKMTDARGQPMGRQTYQCFSCGIEDYTFSQLCSRLRDEYGSGLYTIRGRDSKGKYKFGKTIGIAAPKLNDDIKESGENVGALITQFSAAMERQQVRTEELIKGIMGPQSGGDAFDQMTKMATAMGSMMTAMGVQNNAPVAPPSLGEQIKEMMLLKKFMGGFENDGGGGDANLYSLLTATMQSFGAPIAAAIAAGQQSGEVTSQGILEAPKKNPELTPDQKAEKENSEAMKTQIKILIENAKQKSDPKQFASLVVANTPEDKLDELYDFISADDFMERIIVINPEAESYKDWFTALRTEVIELLTEPDEPTDVADPSDVSVQTETPETSDLTKATESEHTPPVVATDPEVNTDGHLSNEARDTGANS